MCVCVCVCVCLCVCLCVCCCFEDLLLVSMGSGRLKPPAAPPADLISSTCASVCRSTSHQQTVYQHSICSGNRSTGNHLLYGHQNCEAAAGPITHIFYLGHFNFEMQVLCWQMHSVQTLNITWQWPSNIVFIQQLYGTSVNYCGLKNYFVQNYFVPQWIQFTV